jgi:Zn-dependent metalloprotease
MRSTPRTTSVLALTVALGIGGVVPTVHAADTPDTSPPSATDTTASSATDTPGLVEGLDEPVDAGVSADKAAREHLRSHKDRYAIDEADLVTASVEAEGGREVVRLDQRHHGVPVLGAQYVVRMTKENGKRTVSGTSGQYFTDLTVDTTARTLAPEKAVQRAVHEAAIGLGIEATSVDPEPLTGEDRGLVVMPAGKGALARHVTVRGADPRTGEPVLQQVYADASSGVVLFHHTALQSADAPVDGTPVAGTGTKLDGTTVPVDLTRDGAGTHWLQDQATPTGAPVVTWDAGGSSRQDLGWAGGGWQELVTIESSPTPDLGPELTETGAVDAHWAAEQVLDYYATRHGRDSLDDAGMAVHSVVGITDWGSPWVNAYWDSEQEIMVYGSGDDRYRSMASDADVVGHEMTHGVVQHTADLVYSGQSGALNEAFADYLGNAIDVEVSGVSMDDLNAGLIGEDLCRTLAPADCALRDLNDGATTAGFISWSDEDAWDAGAVHLNSTIIGGALWDIREELGGEVADAIVYRALTGYLTPLARFTDARDAVVAAAKELGVTGSQLKAVTSAFDRHGVVRGWEKKVLQTDSTTLLGDLNSGFLGVDTAALRPDAAGGWFAVPRSAEAYVAPLSVWVGRTQGNGTPPRQVSPDDGRTHFRPATDGATVVWVAAGETYQILAAPVTGGEPRVLWTTDKTISALSIDDGLVAWSQTGDEGLSQIYYQRPDEAAPHVIASNGRGGDTKPEVHAGKIAYATYLFEPENEVYGGYGIQIYDTGTGQGVWAGRDIGAEYASVPVLTSRGVVWTTDLRMSDNGSWYTEFTTLRAANLDGSDSRALITEEDGDDRVRAWMLTASDTTITLQENAPLDAGANGYTNELMPRLRQYTWDGSPLGRVTCNPGAQLYPAAVEGRAVVWVDSSTTDNDLVIGDGVKGGCV